MSESQAEPAFERSSLSDILSGGREREAPEPQSDPTEPPEPVAAEPTPAPGPARDEAGRFAPKPPEAPAAPEPAEEPDIPQSARIAQLRDERAKRQREEAARQAAEARAAAAEAELARLRAAAPTGGVPPAPAAQQPGPQAQTQAEQDVLTKFFENPEAVLEERDRRILAQIEERQRQDRFNASETAVRSDPSANDYDDATAALGRFMQREKASNDPVRVKAVETIVAALNTHPHPAVVALTYGRQALALEQHNNDPAALQRAQFEQWAAQNGYVKADAVPAPQPARPAPVAPGPSLAAARNVAPRAAAPAFTGPTPLGEMVGFARR